MTTAETEKTRRSVEEIQDELTRAREALAALQQEQAGIQQRLKEAGKEDQDALTEAALSGSLKGAKTPKLDNARSRAAELPFLAWAAEIKVLELSEEHSQAKRAELDAQLQELRPAVEEAEAASKQAQENLNMARNDLHRAVEEKRDLDRGERHRQGRLSQLEEQGPVIGRG